MRLLFFLACFISFSAHSQDLTGIRRGHFRSGNGRMFQMPGDDDRYKFEVQLDQRGKSFKGVTYSYKTTVFYGKAVCNGTVNTATRKVLLEELRIVEVKMAGGDACIMTCFLQYSRSGNEEFLEGTYSSMNERDSTNCGRGTVFLRKVVTSDFYKEPFLVDREKKKPATLPTPAPAPKKPAEKPKVPAKPAAPPVVKKDPPAPVNPKPATPRVESKPKIDSSVVRSIPKPVIPVPKVIASRANELVKTITVPAGRITVNLYDNGTIDNDTVSVYLNNKLVVSKKRLTAAPITSTFDINADEDNIEVVMVAENLGEIPPNTSLMVVKAGDQQYEIRITPTEQKNAVVRFRLSDTP